MLHIAGCALATALLLAFQQEAVISQAISSQKGGIRGRVVDARSGRPVANASVEVSHAGQVAIATTDMTGSYEVPELEPAEYQVFVVAKGYTSAQFGQRYPSEPASGVEVRSGHITADVDVRLHSAGGIQGRIFGDSGNGIPGVEIQLLAERYGVSGLVKSTVAFAQTGEFGLFRVDDLPQGRYYVRAYSAGMRPTKPGQRKVYAPTYYPETTEVEHAQPILIGAGQEISGIDFALLPVETFRVTGTVIDSTGQNVDQVQVSVMSADTISALDRTISVSRKGDFEILDLTPGTYTLMVQPRAGHADARWFGVAQQVRVDSHVSDVKLIARRGARVSGRIVRDAMQPLPFDQSTIRVQLETRQELRPGFVGVLITGAGIGEVQADGTFAAEGVVGPVTFNLSGLPPPWTIKAIRLEGTDITDEFADFGDGARRQVEIVLTDQVADIAGRVTDRDGRNVSSYLVVLFPQRRSHWKWPSRFVRAVRSGRDGSYRIQNLPPADYFAIALEALPQNAWNDPAVLELLSSQATSFQLNEGEQQALSLRLASTPDHLRAMN